MKHLYAVTIIVIVLIALPTTARAAPLGTGFTYQGELNQLGSPANGNFQMTFQLFDDAAAGMQQGPTVGPIGVGVVDGIFTLELDFGLEPFDGTQLWLDITVDGNTLTPRQKLTASPYSLATISSNYDRMAIVSPSGGNYTDPLQAMQNLADWCGTPPISQQCLVYVLPGTYQPAGTIFMEPNVDLVGVDERQAVIQGENFLEGILNFKNCGNQGCDFANLTLNVDAVVAANAAFGIVSTNGGTARGRDIIIELIVTPGSPVGVHNAIRSDGLVQIERLRLNTTMLQGDAIFLFGGGELRLKHCQLFVTGRLANQKVIAIRIDDGDMQSQSCDIQVIGSINNGSATAINIINGSFFDSYSSIRAVASNVAEGLFMDGCRFGGEMRMVGTRITIEESTTLSRGVTIEECDAVAENVFIDSKGAVGVAVRLVQSNLELRHSTLISGGFAVQYGLVSPNPPFIVTISHSLLKAPGQLVDSIDEFTTAVSFSRLEDGFIGSGVICAHNIDENLTDVVCPP